MIPLHCTRFFSCNIGFAEVTGTRQSEGKTSFSFALHSFFRNFVRRKREVNP